MRKRWTTWVVTVCLGPLLAGCGGTQPTGPVVDNRSLLDFERTRRERVEELVAQCMRDRGFDYEPRTETTSDPEVPAGSPFDLSLTREEAQRTGFGIVDGLLAERQAQDLGPDDGGEGATPRAGGGPEGEAPEPGTAYDDAWQSALHGNPATGSPGCRDLAEEQVRAELAAAGPTVEDVLVEIVQLVEADPRYHDLWAQWSRCMAERGVPASDMTTLAQDLAQEASELLLPPPPRGEDAPPPPAPAGEVDPVAVQELRDREIRAAVAAVDCFEPLKPRYYEIVSDAERAAAGGS